MLPALLLPGGCVLVMPQSVGVVSRSLAKTRELQRRDGMPPSPAFQILADTFDEATEIVRRSATGTSEVPQQSRVTASPASDRGSVLADPMSAEQAAELLGCSARNVRALCSREVFETAQRTRAGWEIERTEVQERAREKPPSVVLGSRGRAYWAGADAQAQR